MAKRQLRRGKCGRMRVSAHAYNTEDDIDAVLAGLARHRHLLA